MKIRVVASFCTHRFYLLANGQLTKYAKNAYLFENQDIADDCCKKLSNSVMRYFDRGHVITEEVK